MEHRNRLIGKRVRYTLIMSQNVCGLVLFLDVYSYFGILRFAFYAHFYVLTFCWQCSLFISIISTARRVVCAPMYVLWHSCRAFLLINVMMCVLQQMRIKINPKI